MKNVLKLSGLLLSIALFNSCAAVDLRTEAVKNNTEENAEKMGRELLTETKIAMGYDRLSSTEVYEAKTVFNWKGLWLLLPMNTFPGNNKKTLSMRFATNTFDGQVEYYEGRKKGTIQGVQSWEGYKTERDSDWLKRHQHDRYIWGLATYHYLIEAPMHLPEAEIVRYAGTRIVDDIAYETVYVTWGSEAPNKQFDRFLVYVHPETKFIDLLEVTISDYFLPMPKNMQHATARYERTKTAINAYLPSKIAVQLKGPKKKSNSVYDILLSDYSFDNFDKAVLYPIEGLDAIGFTKPVEK